VGRGGSANGTGRRKYLQSTKSQGTLTEMSSALCLHCPLSMDSQMVPHCLPKRACLLHLLVLHLLWEDIVGWGAPQGRERWRKGRDCPMGLLIVKTHKFP
jgi:hypothetical protein